jgi:hypothetical protein
MDLVKIKMNYFLLLVKLFENFILYNEEINEL